MSLAPWESRPLQWNIKFIIPLNLFFCFTTGGIFLEANELVLLSSPLYPDNYPVNLDITWIIRTEQHRWIRIDFIAFDTERNYDFFEAGDGADFSNSSTALFWWSGPNLPPRLLSNGNVMWLRFTSDYIFTRSGFSLMAQSVSSNGTLRLSTFWNDKVILLGTRSLINYIHVMVSFAISNPHF